MNLLCFVGPARAGSGQPQRQMGLGGTSAASSSVAPTGYDAAGGNDAADPGEGGGKAAPGNIVEEFHLKTGHGITATCRKSKN